MKKALITGIAGFAGSHLAELLLLNNFQVSGFYLKKHPTNNIDQIKSKINLVQVDLNSKQETLESISKIKPDFVFHLAAYSSPARSFNNPQETLTNNVVSQLNLLEALKISNPKAKILIIGSADEYGQIKKENLPADENTPLAPASPYAVSKVAQDLLGYQYYLHYKMHIIRVRPFNHIGPRQALDFVVPAFANRIAMLEKNNKAELRVGYIKPMRDFTDVRDMCNAYLLALLKCIPGEVYNIGSGKPVKIEDILKILVSLSKVKIKIIEDKKLFRPVDIEEIYCNPDKFIKATGWKPKVKLEKTLSDTIEYERQNIN